MLRVWNLSLLLATFSPRSWDVFLTRSGVLDSVHASPSRPWARHTAFSLRRWSVVVVLIGWR